jgi:gamma-glutamylcyclotransferase (GGCT)/AIG2-like uncharacterized protein YtfP
MNTHLFVYGSLLSTAGHAKGDRLREEARLIGPATIAAQLYRYSWYPVASESADREARVHGELYALTDPARSLVWLDDYEGLPLGKTVGDKYHRVERTALLATGTEVRAWVYLYRKDPGGLAAVPDGRWRAPPR